MLPCLVALCYHHFLSTSNETQIPEKYFRSRHVKLLRGVPFSPRKCHLVKSSCHDFVFRTLCFLLQYKEVLTEKKSNTLHVLYLFTSPKVRGFETINILKIMKFPTTYFSGNDKFHKQYSYILIGVTLPFLSISSFSF
jgi:hypothetical protein